MSTLDVLNNHLFKQIKNLSNENLTEKQVKQEIDKSKAMTGVATQIINSAKLQLEAQKVYNEKPDKQPQVFKVEDQS